MKIVHTCSSVLVRPNGIVRYINAVLALQSQLGNETVFVCDSLPTQNIASEKIYYKNSESQYKPNVKNSHVWLQVDQAVVDDLVSVFQKYAAKADLVIAHDLHSYLAASLFFDNGIFVQHESDVLTPGSRWSFLSDEYLAQQISVVNNTSWRVGVTVKSKNINPKRAVYTPVPFDAAIDKGSKRSKGLLYVGDATERKGAREFMHLANDLGVTPTVISHEIDKWLFHGADVRQFSLDEKDSMYSLMRQHRVAFISSKNECPGIAALECLQFMPVVVDSKYNWTTYLDGMGAIRTTGVELENKIGELLTHEWVTGSEKLQEWSEYAQQFWKNLSI